MSSDWAACAQADCQGQELDCPAAGARPLLCRSDLGQQIAAAVYEILVWTAISREDLIRYKRPAL